MSIFNRLLSIHKQNNNNCRDEKSNKNNIFFTDEKNDDIIPVHTRTGDSYLYNAWVYIAVNILIRNIARADFVIRKDGNEVISGSLYGLFRRPNTMLSRYDLWKETAAWWNLEGEACDQRSLRWFGPEYAGGLPKELYVLNPRKMQHERGTIAWHYRGA